MLLDPGNLLMTGGMHIVWEDGQAGRFSSLVVILWIQLLFEKVEEGLYSQSKLSS